MCTPYVCNILAVCSSTADTFADKGLGRRSHLALIQVLKLVSQNHDLCCYLLPFVGPRQSHLKLSGEDFVEVVSSLQPAFEYA
jgi:hypothetical protein